MTYWLRAADDVVNHRRAGDLQPSISTACVFPSCTYLDTSISKPFFFSVSSAWKLKSKQSFLRVKTYSNSTLYKWHFFQIWTFKKIPVKSILDISSGSATFGTAGECVWNMQVALGLSRQEAGHSPTHTRICEYPELLPRCIFSRAYSDMIWKCDRGVGRRRFVSHITFLKCQESGCTLLFCFGFFFFSFYLKATTEKMSNMVELNLRKITRGIY